MYKKVYLSRATTRSMATEYPIGDPTGGPAYGEKNDPVSAAIVGGTALVGGYMQSQAAGKAASQYADTANRGMQYNQDMFNRINEQNAPYRTLGEKGALQYGNFIDNGYFTSQPSMNDLTALMPNYEFGLRQGMGQFNAQQNAAGGLISGNAIQGGQQFAQDYAGNALQNAFNNFQTNRQNVASNVGAATGFGLNANQITSSAGTGASSNASNLLSSIGNAQAAGTMGQANAYASGLNNISNYAMLYGMMNRTPATSDIRTKQNIEQIGWLPNGLPVYSYEYKEEFKNDPLAGSEKYVGVMAHEVEKIIPDAVSLRSDGYKMVDYSKV
jgi:hypothetical protein